MLLKKLFLSFIACWSVLSTNRLNQVEGLIDPVKSIEPLHSKKSMLENFEYSKGLNSMEKLPKDLLNNFDIYFDNIQRWDGSNSSMEFKRFLKTLFSV